MGFRVPLKDEMKSLERDSKNYEVCPLCKRIVPKKELKLSKKVLMYICKKCRQKL